MSDAVLQLQIRSDVDLVAVVLYLLGFQLGDGSIVVMAVADNLVVFGARLDLPGPDDPTTALLDMSHHIADVARRAHPDPTATGETIQQAIIEATPRLEMQGDDVHETAAPAVTEAFRRHADGVSPDEGELAWLLVLLAHSSIWSLVLSRTEPSPEHLAFWTEVTRRALRVGPTNENATADLWAAKSGISPAEIERSIARLHMAMNPEDDHGK